MSEVGVIDLTDESCPASPFYLLASCLSNESHELTLNDILCGQIKSILLMNYMYDFPWLAVHCPILSV
jgi:hypothetical protein